MRRRGEPEITPAGFRDIATNPTINDRALGEAVEKFLRGHPREDHRVDYKGRAGTHPDQRDADELLRDVTSFANADGGTMLFGVEEAKDRRQESRAVWPPSGVDDEGDSLVTWIEQCLRRLSPHLFPAPAVRRVELGSVSVVVVAVRRSARLVPCPEKGGTSAYYLRSGEGKFRVPDYLYFDLAMGRRERPDFHVKVEAEVVGLGLSSGGGRLDLGVSVSVVGAAWAPEFSVVAIGHSDTSQRGIRGWPVEPEDPAPPMLAMVRVPRFRALEPNVKLMASAPKGPLPPLRSAGVEFSMGVTSSDLSRVWRGTVVVIPSNGPPTWAQIDVRFGPVPADKESFKLPATVSVEHLSEGEMGEVLFGAQSAYEQFVAGDPDP